MNLTEYEDNITIEDIREVLMEAKMQRKDDGTGSERASIVGVKGGRAKRNHQPNRSSKEVMHVKS